MYKVGRILRSSLTSTEVVEGEPLELKIERIVNNNEPITDGAPEIFTDRKDGVVSAYNIRADRWEIAADAMDAVHRSTIARRDNVGKQPELKVVKDEDGGAKSTRGENPQTGSTNE